MKRIIVLSLLFTLFALASTVKKQIKTRKICQDKSLKTAIILGNSKCLPRELKNKMKALNLLHLTTLSGLHLSSLIKYSKLLFSKKFILLTLILGFLLEGYFSFKRMIILRWLKGMFFRIPLFYLFLLVSFIDLINGQFNSSPLSLIFSCAFIGTLLTSEARNNLVLCIEMLFAQIFLCFCLGQKVLILNFISNFFVIPIFSLIFPLFYLPYADEVISKYFAKIILLLFDLCSIIPAIHVGPILVLIALSFYLNLKPRLLLIMLFLIPQQLPKTKSYNYQRNVFKIKKNKSYRQVIKSFYK